MKGKRLVLSVVLSLLTAMCLFFGLVGCGGGGSETEGTYYLYENGEQRTDKFIKLEGGKWSDESDGSGDYSVSGDVIIFYVDFFGEREEYADGTLKGGVLTVEIEGVTYVYCKAGVTPSGSSQTVPEHTHSFSEEWKNDGTYHWHEATCEHADVKGELAQHTFGYDNKCSVCGYELEYTEGLDYTLDEEAQEYAVSGMGTATDREVVVPYGHEGLPVTSVAESAFAHENGLVSIVLQHGVTSIGTSAFSYAENLVSVTLPETLKSIGTSAFLGTSRLFEVYNLAKIDLSKQLGSGLASANIVNNYKDGSEASKVRIEQDYLFYEFGSLELIGYLGTETSLSLPLLETKDEDNNNVDLPYAIHDGAFRNNTALTSVSLPRTVTGIGKEVFFNCTALGTVTFSGKMDFIGEQAFSYCAFTNFTVPSGVKVLEKEVFEGCENLNRITLPDGLKRIGEGVFFGDTSLTSVTIPSSVYQVGESAFGGASKLAQVEMKKTVGWRANSYAITAEDAKNPETMAQYFTYEYQMCTWNRYDYNAASHWQEYSEKEEHSLDGTETCTVCGFRYAVTDGLFYQKNNTGYTVSPGSAKGETFIVIPKTYEGENVTELGDFSDCSMAAIEIPDTVTVCRSFEGCKNLAELDLPDGVTSLRNFSYCTSLVSVTFGKITSVWESAFSGCTSLKEIVLPETVKEIGQGATGGAFRGCTSLESVTIGGGAIGRIAFQDCTALKSVTFGGGDITFSEYNPFDGCDNLEKIVVTDLAKYCGIDFYQNNPLAVAKHLYYEGEEVTDLVIPDGVTRIGSWAFQGWDALKSITVPASVTSFGYCAFHDCTGLQAAYITDLAAWYAIDHEGDGSFWSIDTFSVPHLYLNGQEVKEIKIPEGTTSIGASAFAHRNDLAGELKIPAGVVSIGQYAFYGCENLTSVVIPDSVKQIGTMAFGGCTKLADITLPDTVIEIGSGICDNTAYENEASHWDSNVAHQGGLYIGNHLIGTENVKAYTVRAGTKTVAGDSFYSSVTSVELPDGLLAIGPGAFHYCQAKTVQIPSSVQLIGEGAFEGSYLETIVIPNGITAIPDSMFGGCSHLVSVTLPGGITSIGKGAFARCGELPHIDLPAGLTSIGENAFNQCRKLTEIDIPDSVTSIGRNAFYISGLQSVVLPSSLQTIGEYAFNNSYLTVVVINSSVSIGANAFSYCTKLQSLTISENVRSIDIGAQAFDGDEKLRTVTFESPEGWYYSPDASGSNGTLLSDLEDASSAATYLLSHTGHYWKEN